MKSHKGLLGFGALVVTLVAVVGLWVSRSSAHKGDAQRQAQSPIPSEAQTRPAKAHGHWSVAGGEPAVAMPMHGIPKAQQESVASIYEFVRKCDARRQFRSFIAQEKNNPDSIQNNPEKLKQLPPEVRARYLEKISMLNEWSPECDEWEHSVSAQESSQQLYSSALANALAGDQDAAACFLAAPWATPAEGTEEYARLSTQYRENSKSLVELGVSNGSWPVVIAATSAVAAEHGIKTANGIDLPYAYYLARLMQLGAPSGDLSQSYGFEAAKLGVRLSQENIKLATIDQQAQQTFSRNFGGHYLDDTQSFTKLCGQ